MSECDEVMGQGMGGLCAEDANLSLLKGAGLVGVDLGQFGLQ
jgi:hypothetical protein